MEFKAALFAGTDEKDQEYVEFMKRFNLDAQVHSSNDPLFSDLRMMVAPSIALLTSGNYRIKYYGKPEGREEEAFRDVLAYIRTGNITLSNSTISCIKNVQRYLNAKLYVTPICPYCPRMFKWLAQLTVISQYITLEVINVFDFFEMAKTEDITAVPYLVINDKYKLLGFHQEDLICAHILAALGQLYQ
ncbi:MAG: thioredoxin family protein [Nitrososphaerota archaeon]|jgi:alkyl hydroperoxide reductase subunit AhpF|nr:thioredoxin family protein [Nitrososphaerota archaeon]MDG7041289.1 thioredoxin family protein [Nitrososphaerota archaeon]MDG7042055.1 thioredoxin family protein [Nitrososphaerota archaeon]MDG7046661.1 thioredoxin family protein [Nitrososphaerota archaeon]